MVADISGKSWSLGPLSKSGKNYETHENSQLTVWWSLCYSNCTGNINLWYEDKEQRLRQGIGAGQGVGPDWSEPNWIITNLTAGGALAATAIAPHLNGTDSWSPRLFYEQDGRISEMVHEDTRGWLWGTSILSAQEQVSRP